MGFGAADRINRYWNEGMEYGNIGIGLNFEQVLLSNFWVAPYYADGCRLQYEALGEQKALSSFASWL